MDKNVCPYCGNHRITWASHADVPGYYGICLFIEDHSKGCGAEGPCRATKEGALDAFTHPAHLMSSLHTYDPATEVKVSRGTAKCALINIPGSAEGGVSPREHAARAELRAALEVGE